MDKITADFLLEEQHDACRHGIGEVGVVAHPLSVHSTMVTPDVALSSQ